VYVCICKGISDKDIKNAMVSHQSTRDILKALGVGSDCGSCVVDAIEIIRQEQGTKEFSKSQPVQSPTNPQ
jgi:bacterioferritin-associated ferredoxin